MREVPFYPFWIGALGLGEAHSSTWIFQAVQGPLCSVESQEKRGSHVRLFVTPWTAASQASLSLTISLSLPKFMSIASVMPSNHLILWQPLLLLSSIFPSIRDFSNESAVCIRWPTMEFQLQHQSFQQEFRVDFPYDWLVWSHCYPKDCQESSPAPQFKGINSLALFIFYGPALTTVQLNSARG